MKKRTIGLTTAVSLAVMTGFTFQATTGQTAVASVISKPTIKLTDIQNHWGKEAIEGAIHTGYVDGYEDGTFRPDQNVSRAEFLKMTATALKLKVGAIEEGNNWHTAYVKAAEEAGILHEGDFKAGNIGTTISRIEMAKIALRASDKELQKKEYSLTESTAMYNSVKKGLIQGLGNGELAPAAATTRAQSVTIIDRILGVSASKELPVDKAALSVAEVEMTGSNVKSFFNIDPRMIGSTWFLDTGVKAELQQLIIADQNDPADPFMHLVDISEWWPPKANKAKDVIVLAKFKVTIEDTAPKGIILYANQHFMLGDTTGIIRVRPEYKLAGAMEYDKPGVYSGYVAYSLEKLPNVRDRIMFTIAGKNYFLAAKEGEK
ncbi:S-layer homology domain-containing protein [Paenibacillus validus]|uniref:SLH domain-containing protein n=1 Tax=Paenibacillus validus TaxID=44253 RepID=A0A7X2Z738_9BACL|nr:S-layer homology domain-containing protein [Paenibacillus validus]MUG69529.1 hypothetical protein [Paenibacillus validus]